MTQECHKFQYNTPRFKTERGLSSLNSCWNTCVANKHGLSEYPLQFPVCHLTDLKFDDWNIGDEVHVKYNAFSSEDKHLFLEIWPLWRKCPYEQGITPFFFIPWIHRLIKSLSCLRSYRKTTMHWSFSSIVLCPFISQIRGSNKCTLGI